MKRTSVNPWEWNIKFGFHQAELVEGHRSMLVCAGQTSLDENGEVAHPGDMAAQIGLALDNVETVLHAAGMRLSDVVRLNMYTTDMEQFLQHVSVMGKRLEAAGVAPPGSLLQVSGLAFPGLVVELEATAVA
ncbi:RidA family protein [Nonomuraea sp. KC401]|uniref:RidA family protein n=1 Tax=Nonomuraea longispora TaxID=1848320 RepID=A0A4R4NDX4_9ACTN|nr:MULTISPECIES: RidA family protein [Nonomuraea]NBE96554.1 RidA family protein [Nonomuraea sp. K271]TDC07149.1 RidA family protein [Nonomuraea longispora]TLF86344.1 RidA family protein [Nonomuraea sp. KC401]